MCVCCQTGADAFIKSEFSKASMTLRTLFIVNKAGSLIFYRRLDEKAPQLSQNDTLHLASTFHGMQLLVQQLSPEFPTPFGFGIVALVTDDFALEAFKSASGVQFFVTADLHDSDTLAIFLVSFISFTYKCINIYMYVYIYSSHKKYTVYNSVIGREIAMLLWSSN